MSATRHNAFQRLFRGETSYDFVGRWKRWFAISGVIILIGLISLATRGLNFSIEFKGGTVWEVPSSASVSHARSVVGTAVPGYGQATITILTNPQTGQRTVKVEAPAKETGDQTQVAAVTNALAKMANVSPNDVQLNDIGPSWGSDITDKAIKAVIIFLVVVGLDIWLRFDGKMALAALVALIHDILMTLGIYSLSRIPGQPRHGDRLPHHPRVLALRHHRGIRPGAGEHPRPGVDQPADLLRHRQPLHEPGAGPIDQHVAGRHPARSCRSWSIGAWVLGATALQDFGLALFVGLTTGAYSSIFIASPSAGAAQGTRAPLRRDPPPAGDIGLGLQAHHSRRGRHRRPERRRAGGRGRRQLRPPLRPGRGSGAIRPTPSGRWLRSGNARPGRRPWSAALWRADGCGSRPPGRASRLRRPTTVGGDRPPESGERPASGEPESASPDPRSRIR